jgi:chorismate mutase
MASLFLLFIGEKMTVRGVRGAIVRGAITVEKNDAEMILAGTTELLLAILDANPTLRAPEIASTFFTVTEDLDAVHPAKAAREFGWVNTPMICAREIPVPGSLPLCIRVLLHWNTTISPDKVQHIYLKNAEGLRPDLMKERT